MIDRLSPLSLSGQVRFKWLGNPSAFPASEVERFRSSGINVFHMAVGWGGPDAYQEAMEYFMLHNSFIADRADAFMRIDSVDDLAKVKASGRVGILLGAQNSDHFVKPHFDPRDMLNTVDEFYRYGRRILPAHLQRDDLVRERIDRPGRWRPERPWGGTRGPDERGRDGDRHGS